MMQETTGAAAAPSVVAPDSSKTKTSAAAARTQRRRKPVLRVLLLAVAIGAGAWGVPRHPRYLEWRLARLPLSELEKERAGRVDDSRLLYHIGLRLNDQERFAEADPFLRRAVELDPDTPRLRDEWARALLGSGLTTAAFGQLREFAGTRPDSAEARFILGKFYFSQRSMSRAAEELEAAARLDPASAQARSYLAGAYEALGETEKARKAIEEALRLRPDHALDRLMYASLLERGNRMDAARAEYARAASLAPRNAVILREYARWLLDKGSGGSEDRALAETLARTAVTVNADDAGAHLVLGRALALSGKIAEAVAPLTRAAELAPDDMAAPLALSPVLRRLKRDKEAVAWEKRLQERRRFAAEYKTLLEAIRVTPKDPALHRKMARLLAGRGDVAGSVHHQAAALRRPVDSPQTLIAAAGDLTAGGHAEEALPLALRAVAIGEYSPYAHEALGDAYLGLGRIHQAGIAYNTAAGLLASRRQPIKEKMARALAKREANPPASERAYREARRLSTSQIGPRPITEDVERLAKRAVTLEPENPTYLWYLLSIQIALRKQEEAIATGKTLLSIAPDYARAHAMMATLLVEKAARPEEFAEVEAHLKKAASDPEAAPARHYALGLLALQKGQGKEAARELRAAARLDPGPVVTYYKLARAEEMAGNRAAAQKAMELFHLLQKDKQEQADALSDLAQNPNRPEGYAKAAKVFEAQGLQEQADAIRAEARRRFGGKGGQG